MTEEWRPVVGYEGLYSVSSEGRVRTEGKGGGRTAGRILKASPGSIGYPVVSLWKSNRAQTAYVHRLVCEAFHGSAPEDQTYVLHWNDIKTDNRAENLRWGSQAENLGDAARNGLLTRPKRTHCGKGHELSGYNAMVFASGFTVCRTCRVETTRNWRLKNGK